MIILWALGLVSSYTMGGFIHVLLVLAIIVILLNVIQGRRASESKKFASGLMPQRTRMNTYTMKTYTIAAIFLIAIGIVAFAYQGISYTSREKVVDFGPIQMTAERTRTMPLSPIVGSIALVGGIALLVVGKRKA
jgi:predicted membrane protein